ncbi:MAG: serine/threonine-protein kinase [Pseudomonadota bacterium]
MTEPDSQDTGKQLLRLVEDALDVPHAERTPWLDEHCPAALRSRAERLISAAAEETGMGEDEITLMVRSAEQRLTGQRIGPYRVLELIGEGGMGQVYLAERDDGAFDAKVAVKVIRASAIGSRAVAQFERERQILSDMRHSGIANLLDGGTTDDGLPFVVMEYIDGDPLDVYLRTHPLPIADRIRLFLKICGAVEHAHRALVIHRDIKPSNVLVTEDGEPKLLDFGIARSLLPKESGEETVAMLLTPAYASPEQVTGEPLTTATDVYSLGVALYQMLTGERPFDTESLSPSQYEQVITQRRPDAPSQRARQRDLAEWGHLRGELDAIVLKAMAKEPERRYPSVAAFADDLRRYLEGFPVQAKGDSLAYRVGKFVRRRRFAVAGATVAIAALAVAYAITLVQYQAATEARQRADARFDQARRLAREVLYDVYDRMSHVQGTLPAREQLAATGERFLDELAADPSAPPDLLLDIGSNYSRLYDVFAGLGVSSLGQNERGLEQLDKAELALEKLLELEPDNTQAVTEMVWVKRLATNHTLHYDMNTDAAQAHAREGLTLADRAIDQQATPDWTLQSRRWNLRIDLVKVLVWAREFEDALNLLGEYLPQLEQPAWRENLGNWAGKRAYAYGLRGETYADSGDAQAAIPDYLEALQFYEGRAAEEPENVQLLVQLIRFNHNLGNLHASLDQFEDALRYGIASREAAQTLVDAEPRDAQSRRNLALTHQQIAKALSGLERHDDARSSIDLAVNTFRQLAEDEEDNDALVRDQAIALTDAGDIAAATTDQAEDGCPYYRHAETLFRSLQREGGTLSAADIAGGLDPVQERLSQRCR